MFCVGNRIRLVVNRKNQEEKMNRVAGRLFLVGVVALLVLSVGWSARAAIPLETDPSWHSTDQIRTYDLEWYFATAGSVYPDLYAANIDGPVYVYLNSAADPVVISATPATVSAVSEHAIDIDFGDFNGDGYNDMALVLDDGTVEVYRATTGTVSTDWTLVWESYQPPTTNTTKAKWADIDQDGYADLILIGDPDYIKVYYSDQIDTFRYHSGSSDYPDWESPSQYHALCIDTGDVSGDGYPDFVIGTGDWDPLYLFIYDPTSGYYLPDPVWESAATPITKGVLLRDFDKDDQLDLAAGNVGDPSFIYVNTGSDPWFQATPDWQSDGYFDTYDICAADFDVDSDPGTENDLDLVEGNFGQSDVIYQNNTTTIGVLDMTTSPAWTSEFATGQTLSLACADIGEDLTATEPTIDPELAAGDWDQFNVIYMNWSELGPYLDNQVPAEGATCAGLECDMTLEVQGSYGSYGDYNIYLEVWASAPGASITSIKMFVDSTTSTMQEVTASVATNAVTYDGIPARYWEVYYLETRAWNWGDTVYVRVNATDSNLRFRSMTYSFDIMDDIWLYASDPEETEVWPADSTLWYTLADTCCTISTYYSTLEWTGPWGPTIATLNCTMTATGPTLYTISCTTPDGYALGPGSYTWHFWGTDECGGPCNRTFDYTIHFTVVGPVWPSFRHDPAHSGTTVYPAYMDCPSRRWTYPVAGDPQIGDIYSSPAKDGEGYVYFMDTDGILYRVASSGTLDWSVDTGGLAADVRYGVVLGPTATDNTIVYVPLGTMVRAYSASSGSLVGTYTLPSSNRIRSSLLLYFEGNDPTLPRIAFGTRQDVATDNFFILDADPSTWSAELGSCYIDGHIMSTPAVDPAGDYVWVATDNGEVNKVDVTDPTNPSVVATFDTSVYEGGSGSLIHGSPSVATDGSVFFGDDGGFFYKIGSDATIGSTGWYVEIGETIHSSPALFTTGATLCVAFGDNYGTLWVFGAYQLTPTIATTAAFFTAGPQDGAGSAILNGISVSADGYIYFGSDNGRLYCVDATQGGASYDHNLWNILLGDHIQVAPAIGYYGEVDVATLTGTGAGGSAIEIISDCDAPSTSCLSINYLTTDYTNTSDFQLRYFGTDTKSGVEQIDFYRKPKNGGSYQNIGTVYPSAPGYDVNGVFDTSLATQGTFYFYTIGQDRREPPNVENPPAGFDCQITYDSIAPEATCSSEAVWTTTATLAINTWAWDPTTATTNVSGLKTVKLYTQFKADNCGSSWGSWQEQSSFEQDYPAGTTQATACLQFMPPSEGYYRFGLVPGDWADNWQSEPPATYCSLTVVDYTEPESETIGCAATNNPVIHRAYHASDAISGLSRVDLYYWYSNDGGASWTGFTFAYTIKTAPDGDDTNCYWDGEWTFDVSGIGEGIYRFVTIASDTVGNEETHPSNPDEMPYYQVYYDISKPETWAIVDPTWWNYEANSPTVGTIKVCFDSTFPEPGGSGLEQVTLWWRYKEDCTGDWSEWRDTLTTPITASTIGTTLTSGCWYFPETGYATEGTYEFYTIGEDFAGNTEDVPAVADDDAMYENTPPESEAFVDPTYANSAVDIGLSSWDDPGTCSSGIATVAALMRYEGDATWSTISGLMIPTSGTVSWVPSPPWEGLYRILSNAKDRAGNWEYRSQAHMPSAEDDWFVYDVSAPAATLSCVSPPYLGSPATIEYEFTDENASGTTVTAMNYVQLWARATDGTLYLVATDTTIHGQTGPGTSSFTFMPPYEGTFGLYTVGYDRGGNFEGSTSTECTITFDWTAPTSTITSVVPHFATADPADDCLTITFVATDAVSGIKEVHLYYRYSVDGGATWEPATTGTCGWRDFGLDVPSSIQYGVTSGTITFCFDDLLDGDVDGLYEFYTCAWDHAGNMQTPIDKDGDGCHDRFDWAIRDTTGPWSNAECTENLYPNHIANTSVVEVCYEAGDGSGLNLDLVELWFRYYMADYSTWTHWTTDSTLRYEGAPVATSGVFYFDTLAAYGHGDGIYQFFTRARDEAGNWERMPEYPPRDYDTYLMVDTTAPTSSCAVEDTLYSGGLIGIDYTASDELSGVAQVELWYATTGSVWTWATAGTTSTAEAGTFWFDPASYGISSGVLRFYVQPTDVAGNTAADPSGEVGCGPVYYDTDEPTVACSSAEYAMGPTIDIGFTASDATTLVDNVKMYYSFEGSDWVDSDITKENTGSDNPFSDTFSFAPETGEGEYTFKLVATDLVGNTGECYTTTIFDETKPTTECTGQDYVIGGPIVLTLFGEDPQTNARTVSGIDYVELFYMYSPDGDFSSSSWGSTGVTTATIDTLGSFTMSWNPTEGDGWYRFYTIGHDKAGNVEDAPYHYDWELAYESGASLVTSFCWTRANQHYWTEEIVIEYIATPTTTALDHVELWYRYQAYPGASWTEWAYSGYIGYETYGKFNFAEFDYGEGLYQFYTHAVEVSGLEEEHNADPNLRYDCWGHYDFTPPESFASVASQFTNATNINVSIDYDDYVLQGGSDVSCVELWYRLEGGTWEHTACQSVSGGSPQDVIFTATQDGLYEFYSIAEDNAGNREESPTDRDGTIIRDTLEPWAVCAAPSATNMLPLTVTYQADDTLGTTPNISGLDSVRLYYMFAADGASWPPAWTDTGLVSSTGSFEFNFPDGQGVYRFYAEATDRAGNVETFNGAYEAETVYDTLAPFSSAASPTFCTDSTVDVTFTADDRQAGSVLPSGVSVVELWYRFFDTGTGTWTEWTDSGLRGTGTGGTIEFDVDEYGLGEGDYEFYTIAVDLAGNRETAPDVADDSTTVAITLPASAAVDDKTQDYDNDGLIQVYYEAHSPVAGIADVQLWYRYSADGSTWTPWSEATEASRATLFFAFYADLPPADGVTDEGYYQFYTIAIDEAGNVEQPPFAGDEILADCAVVEDITPGSSVLEVPGCSGTDQVLVHFQASDGLSGLARVELEMSTIASVWVPTGLSSTQASGVLLFVPPAEGRYLLTTVSYDRASNVEGDKDARAKEFVYDKTAPETTLTRTVAATRSVPIPIDFNVLEEGCGVDEVRLYYKLNPNDPRWIDCGLSNKGTEGTITFVPPGNQEGRYFLGASTTDLAGNVEGLPPVGSYDIEVIYDITPPQTSAPDPATRLLADCETIGVSYVASDNLSAIKSVSLYYKHEDGPWTDSLLRETGATGEFAFLPPEADGTYYFIMVAEDQAGNVEQFVPSETGMAWFMYDTQPPYVVDGSIEPEPDSVGVPRDANISFTLADGGYGVDVTTIDVEVVDQFGRNITASTLSTTVNDDGTVDVLFDPYKFFGYEDVITVYVTACDLVPGCANCITTPISWSFTVTSRTLPSLSEGSVTPEVGYVPLNTEFSYEVKYYSATADPPTTKLVYIDGVSHEMELASGDPWNGYYQFTISGLEAGVHEYYFLFATSAGDQARLPAVGTESGPTVYERLSTTLTCSVLPEEPKVHDTIRVFGTLGTGATGETITVSFTTPVETFSDTTVTTEDGEYSLEASASVIGPWSVSAYWAGNDNYSPVESDVVTFDVSRIPTTVDLDVQPRSITLGETVQVTGRVNASPPVVDGVVYIELVNPVGERLDPIEVELLADGSFAIDDFGLLTLLGTWEVKAVFDGTAEYAASESDPVTVAVTGGDAAILINGFTEYTRARTMKTFTADFVYQTLLRRGLGSADVFYLSADESEYRDAPASYDELVNAVGQLVDRAQAGRAPRTLYVILIGEITTGHMFRLGQQDEISYTGLQSQIESIKDAAPDMRIVGVMGFSGSKDYAEYLAKIEDTVAIASAVQEDGYSYPGVQHGDLFLAEFFSAVNTDKNVAQAFDMASDAVKVLHSHQEPRLFDPFGLAGSTSVGVWTVRGDLAPILVDYAEGSSFAETATPPTVQLWAHVADDVAVSDVFAVVMTPTYDETGEPFTGEVGMSKISLERRIGGLWTGSLELTLPGQYVVAYLAKDGVGNVSELGEARYTRAMLQTEIGLNGYMFRPGDVLAVSVGYTNPIDAPVLVDYYLAVLFPDGALLFWNGLVGYDTATPYFSGYLPPSGHLDLTPIIWVGIPSGVPYGVYSWCAAFVEPGSELGELRLMSNVAAEYMEIQP